MNTPLVNMLNNELKNFNLIVIKVLYFKKDTRLVVHLRGEGKGREKEINKIIYDKLKIDSLEVQTILYNINSKSLEEVSKECWVEVVHSICSKSPVYRDCLLNCKREISKEKLVLTQGNKFMKGMLEQNKIKDKLKENIFNLYGLKADIEFNYDKEIEKDNTYDTSKEELKEIKNIIKESNITPKKEEKYEKATGDDSIILGKAIKKPPVSIIDIVEEEKDIVVEGQIFKKDVRETRTKSKILTFAITDKTSSILCKIFIKAGGDESIIGDIKKGESIRIRGNAAYDIYAKEISLKCNDICKVKKKEKKDLSTIKRVELHCHTKMSAMDGVSDTRSIVERAASYGHKAIAITDHGVVQAYPEAMETAKKKGIKIIYGIEGYLVDDTKDLILDDRSLDSTYVVFDIETTGLSILNNKIIEIGAVKIEKGEIIDRFSSFINPEEDLPEIIKDLTGITDDMLKDEKKYEEVIPKFIDFIGDSVLVAHNADFDVPFLKTWCKKLGISLDNKVLDTIPLSKLIYKGLKKYKLDSICKHLGINLLNHHRAIDDAKATGDILVNIFKELKEKEIFDLKALNKYYLENLDIKKLNTNHVIILVKNMVGLKNLYKLVSLSNLEYFYRKPRLPKSKIDFYREGLIIGAACEAGEVYQEILLNRSFEEMERIINYYDYLEIQPNGNNKFLIDKGIIKDIKELQEINKRIITMGNGYNKKTVATSDVHFLDMDDAIYRKILMSGQGFSDASEQAPLYFRNTEEMLEEFSYLGDSLAEEVVISNPSFIESIVEFIKPIPDETFPPKIEGAEEEIRLMALSKTHRIYGDVLPEVVQKRLDKELNSIISNGYAVLYLIAHKLVHKSYEDGYLVGSRGSVGSSFVATMTDITEVNGLPPHYICEECKYSEFITDGSIASGADLPDKICPNCKANLKKDGFDIPFETFLGFEGDKEPDIDLNFSGEYQSTVHKYTEELFGKGHVFKAGTIGTIADKTAYGFVKKYIEGNNLTLSETEIERLSLGCTGVKRTSGQHPGGVMVVPSDNEIYNFTPIQHPADDNDTEIITTHFDYHSISGRLLKLDILGHDDPTVLRMLQDLTGINPKDIPLGDEKVLSLFISPDALGISEKELGCQVGSYGLPEFGTKFVRQMLVDTNPKTFSDLVRISGLSHGTDVWLNNAQFYIKEGYTTLKDCISTRDDIMVYLIHKGLPPKISFYIMEGVRKGKGLSEEQENIMRENNIPDWYIDSCKKIKYMFPKGHAVAYVMMAVRIAYFKVYYPKEYYATYFTVRASDFDGELIIKGEESIALKIKELSQDANNLTQKDKGLLTVLEIAGEMYKRGIRLLKVDLYKSHATKFLVVGDNLLPPMSCLQGVGENAAKNIQEERAKGDFMSLEDLRKRTKVTKTVIETLRAQGCLSGIAETNQLSLF